MVFYKENSSHHHYLQQEVSVFGLVCQLAASCAQFWINHPAFFFLFHIGSGFKWLNFGLTRSRIGKIPTFPFVNTKWSFKQYYLSQSLVFFWILCKCPRQRCVNTCCTAYFLQVLQVINTDSTTFSMDDETLEADTEYAARVRSSPNQVLYMGEWSDWSPEAHWRTESVKKGESSH